MFDETMTYYGFICLDFNSTIHHQKFLEIPIKQNQLEKLEAAKAV
jgi:hypothetical protein